MLKNKKILYLIICSLLSCLLVLPTLFFLHAFDVIDWMPSWDYLNWPICFVITIAPLIGIPFLFKKKILLPIPFLISFSISLGMYFLFLFMGGRSV